MANERFAEAQKIAKKLRAADPKLSQPEAIKRAWKTMKKSK